MLSEEYADIAASRAYYAAFYAVTAHFLLEGKSFRKHSGVESAIHKHLIKTGVWSKYLGQTYSRLREARRTGDYGGEYHVDANELKKAFSRVEDILSAVQKLHPDLFI
jgi:hypothetical protein